MKVKRDKFDKLVDDIGNTPNTGVYHLPWTKNISTYDFGLFLKSKTRIKYNNSATLYRCVLMSEGNGWIYRATRKSFHHFNLSRDRVETHKLSYGTKT